MLGQLGFTLPLLIILGVELLAGALLLCPKPFNQPAIALARASHTQVGATIFYTLTGVLLLLMASPVYDGVQLYYYTAQEKAQDKAAGLDVSEHEARTLLSFILTSSSLALMFFLRKLGAVLSQCERQTMSEAALLKQVKGLQSEYARMAGSSGAAKGIGKSGPTTAQPSGPFAGGRLNDEEVAELRRLLADLEKMNSELNSRVEKANRAHQLAESNLAALKTQSKGLENEYDRLLAEHDELRRQLQRAGAALGSDDSRMGKKDE